MNKQNKAQLPKGVEKRFKTIFKDHFDKDPIDCEYCDGKRIKRGFSADEVWLFLVSELAKQKEEIIEELEKMQDISQSSGSLVWNDTIDQAIKKLNDKTN